MYWCMNFRGISHQPCWVAPLAAASFSRPLLRLLLWIVVYLLTRQVLQMRVKMSYETHMNTPADERNHAFFFFFFARHIWMKGTERQLLILLPHDTDKNTNERQSWRDRQTGGVWGGCFRFITRVFILECLRNVRQTRQNWVWSQSQWSLSKSFVALMSEAGANIKKINHLKAQNNKAETEMRETFLLCASKTQRKTVTTP